VARGVEVLSWERVGRGYDLILIFVKYFNDLTGVSKIL